MALAYKLWLLTSLYFSQGLPFGFFSQTLPVLLRKDGVSLELIGLTSILGTPWALKFLWAPWIDAAGSERLGRRRSFILPLQAFGVLLLVLVASLDPTRQLGWVLCAVFVANLIAATQDIATDALAVDLLRAQDRGLGNGVQVSGYRVGMIVGGGLLLGVVDRLGWSHTFLIMAGLLGLATLPVALFREPRSGRAPAAARFSLASIGRFLRRPGMRAWAVVLVTYKLGDALGSSMVRPMLVDRGLSLADLGSLLGIVGFIAGLLGALLGGLLLRVVARPRALFWFGALHGTSLLLYSLPTLPLLYLASGVEHLLGGMATASLFTCMMDRAAPDSPATDYTVQASLVVSAGFATLGSGVLASAVGYPAHFAIATLIAWGGAGAAGYVARQTP